jgi:hypothetical protein
MPPIVIPPIVAWALGAIGAALVARWAAKEWRRVNAELDEVTRRAATERTDRDSLPKLKRDPVTGEYRPD